MKRYEQHNINNKRLKEQQNQYYSYLLNMKNMNRGKINCILSEINTKCKSKRIPKYSNEYYLYHICLVLTDLQKWESLKFVLINQNTYHYKSIQDKHLLWSSLNVYSDAYKKFLIKNNICDHKRSANLVLFIDTSDIYNKNGHDNVGYSMDPKKKKTKISAICDADKNILSLIVTKSMPNLKKSKRNSTKTIKERVAIQIDKKIEAIRKEIKKNINDSTKFKILDSYDKIMNNKNIQKISNKNNTSKPNKKNVAKKTSKISLQNDAKTIEVTLNELPNIKCKKIKLVGDSGYARTKIDKQILLEKYNVELIYPQRKNENKKTPVSVKRYVEKRYVIENVFQKIKKFDRICLRKDKLTTTFTGFLFLATFLVSRK